MKITMFRILVYLLVGGLVGCSSMAKKSASSVGEPAQAKVLRATAYGRLEGDGKLGVNQTWLQAQQAAKLNAYRSLADMLYQEPLDGQKTVGMQVVSDEIYRIYAETYLREARAVDYRTVKDSLKTTMELNLTPRFYRCMSGDRFAVQQCLQEDNKLAITRLGYRPATTTSANLACGSRDCGDQFYVQGFANDKNPLDSVLLDAGLYDAEWAVHTGGSLFGRLFMFQELVHGF